MSNVSLSAISSDENYGLVKVRERLQLWQIKYGSGIIRVGLFKVGKRSSIYCY